MKMFLLFMQIELIFISKAQFRGRASAVTNLIRALPIDETDDRKINRSIDAN